MASTDGAWASGRTTNEEADTIAAILARHSVRFQEAPLYAVELDLDCDQDLDLVVQGSVSGRLYFAAFRRDGMSDTEVLRVPSGVNGREVVAALGRADSGHARDVVVVGSDEGGMTPRLFRWSNAAYQEVHIPKVYLLRMEAEWSAECRRENAPSFDGDGRLVLSRETIPRTSAIGHGVSCGLPRDTLTIGSDSLRR